MPGAKRAGSLDRSVRSPSARRYPDASRHDAVGWTVVTRCPSKNRRTTP